jgi:tetratricopeptide (TPR) repeat protein
MRETSLVRLAGPIALAVALAACAPRVVAPPPAIPASPAYPDFIYPAVPAALSGSDVASRIDRGWRYLQNDDPGQAQEEFDAALQRDPVFVPAHAGRGYVALARGRHERAIESFDRALERDPRYAPALVGRGQALLGLEREAEALDAFEAALAVDPSLTQLGNRVEVLRFRRVQAAIEAARRAAAAGNVADARRHYGTALSASPESAFLHRELAVVEQRAGNVPVALERYRRATELDPQDARSFEQIGVILEARGDDAEALAAFQRAAEIDPRPEITDRLIALSERLREADLPEPLRAIPGTPQITRAQLAALLAVRFEDVLRTAPARQLVMTDTRGHWAQEWMQTVAAASVMDLRENYAFQPEAGVSRVDLAQAVRRLTLLAAPQRPDLALASDKAPVIADVSTTHLNYAAVSFAVATNLMPLLDGERFDVSRPVSGPEALEVLGRLRTMLTGGR